MEWLVKIVQGTIKTTEIINAVLGCLSEVEGVSLLLKRLHTLVHKDLDDSRRI